MNESDWYYLESDMLENLVENKALLEAQLKDFNGKKAKSLLCIDRIPDYGTFYHLCMLILAKHYDERDAKMKEKFPALSSLTNDISSHIEVSIEM